MQPDRSFTLHFQLGMPGTYGYSVGYSTGEPARAGRLPVPVHHDRQRQGRVQGLQHGGELNGKKLAAAGFTKKPNVVGWGGTATISTSKAKAGAPVTISGTAPRS